MCSRERDDHRWKITIPRHHAKLKFRAAAPNYKNGRRKSTKLPLRAVCEHKQTRRKNNLCRFQGHCSRFFHSIFPQLSRSISSRKHKARVRTLIYNKAHTLRSTFFIGNTNDNQLAHCSLPFPLATACAGIERKEQRARTCCCPTTARVNSLAACFFLRPK